MHILGIPSGTWGAQARKAELTSSDKMEEEGGARERETERERERARAGEREERERERSEKKEREREREETERERTRAFPFRLPKKFRAKESGKSFQGNPEP